RGEAAMGYEVACICGNVLTVSEAMTSPPVCCSCGRESPMPPPTESPEQAGAGPSSFTDRPPPDEAPPTPDPLEEFIAPEQAFLRTGERGRQVSVMVTLTTDAIWIQETFRLRSVPLRDLHVERDGYGRELVLTLGPEPSSEKLTLVFASADQGKCWFREVQRRQQLTPDAPSGDRHLPEGVALVRQAPKVPYEVLGRVAFTGTTRWAADRGLQLRAGIRGADAVIELHHQ